MKFLSAGLRSIAANSQNSEAVKNSMAVVTQGRKFIVAGQFFSRFIKDIGSQSQAH
jgi:hypothetical protein